MTILTVDSGTLSQLGNLADLTEIRDESGRVLGYFHPVTATTGSGGNVRRSPFADDELRQRQQQRTGKPLSEVLARLPS